MGDFAGARVGLSSQTFPSARFRRHEESDMSAMVFALRGEIDLANFADVEDTLGRAIDESRDDLVVDCGELTFMDSSGVAVLCRAQERMRAEGRTMRITHTNATTHRLLELLGLLERMAVDRD